MYMFSCSIISRTQKTNNAVGKAAYINREDFKNEYDGTSWKYSKNKSDVAYNAVLLPENCPARFSDPAVLWNEVETFEKRKDSRLARDFVLTLQNDLTTEQNKNLIEDFIKSNFTNNGMIANYAIHNDHKDNIHCHIMTTTREVDQNGFVQKNEKGREWNKKENLEKWRSNFSNITNKHLKLNNIDKTVTNKSNKRQKEELIYKASIEKDEIKQLNIFRDYLKLDNKYISERKSRFEFENKKDKIKALRENRKQKNKEVNKKIDQFIDNKINEVKNKQTNTKKGNKKMNILDSISNTLTELTAQFKSYFSNDKERKDTTNFKMTKSKKGGPATQDKIDESFNGTVILGDSDQRELDNKEKLRRRRKPKPRPGNSSAKKKEEDKNKQPQKIKEKNEDIGFSNNKKNDISARKRFMLDKRKIEFSHNSNNIKNYKATLDINEDRRNNILSSSQLNDNKKAPNSFIEKNKKNEFKSFKENMNKQRKEHKINKQLDKKVDKKISNDFNNFKNNINNSRNENKQQQQQQQNNKKREFKR